MDFNAWNDLAAASEDEVLQRQRSDFETQSQAATQALLRAQRDAEKTRQGEMRGAGVATTTLSNVGSYGDYLKAKQNAQNAAMRLAGGNSGELGDVRRRTNADGGYNANAIEATARLGAREQYVGGQDTQNLMAGNQAAEARRGRDKAAADAKAKQEADTKASWDAHLSNVYGKWMGAHADGGGTEDRTRYAQMLSGGVDTGWALPGRVPGSTGDDRRGWGIEHDAWGTPSKSFGRPTTKKGTAY